MTLPLAGAKIKAADLLGIFPGNTDAWTSYTPTWTNSGGTAPAIGNGNIGGRYMKVGRTVHYYFIMTAGTTTTYGVGGIYQWSLPFAPAAVVSLLPAGRCGINDSSAGTRFNRDLIINGTAQVVIAASEASAYVGPLTPMTWANTDFIAGSGTYEAAS